MHEKKPLCIPLIPLIETNYSSPSIPLIPLSFIRVYVKFIFESINTSSYSYSRNEIDRVIEKLLRRENHDTFMISGETDLKVNISIVWFEATLRCISQAIWDYNRDRTNKRIALLLSSLRE